MLNGKDLCKQYILRLDLSHVQGLETLLIVLIVYTETSEEQVVTGKNGQFYNCLKWSKLYRVIQQRKKIMAKAPHSTGSTNFYIENLPLSIYMIEIQSRYRRVRQVARSSQIQGPSQVLAGTNKIAVKLDTVYTLF